MTDTPSDAPLADDDIPSEAADELETNEPEATSDAPIVPEVEYPNDTLETALARHGITLPAEQVSLLGRYASLLWDWNTKINLTRHTTFEKFVGRDVVDSLALAPSLPPNNRVIDVGTGGGVPGAILKIVRPDLEVILTDTVAKKIRVLDEIVNRMGLKVIVHHGRAEELLKTRAVHTLVVRAVAPLSKLIVWFTPVHQKFERLLIIKGPGWVAERYEARQKHLLEKWQLRKLTEWPLPGTNGNSVLLEIKRREKK
ncbi:MAG: 16S rRNA (guanine(527)-N(7))-methyltransferase RsmG [Planctomycetia bacterium]|nr:16S rRNA (guanine(527)-N(7))-methyltransferase RsmG [Planctomycetia bacterium]